jgi:hypothetical protein
LLGQLEFRDIRLSEENGDLVLQLENGRLRALPSSQVFVVEADDGGFSTNVPCWCASDLRPGRHISSQHGRLLSAAHFAADQIWSVTLELFDAILRADFFQTTARFGSPHADFVDIPYDTWRHYTVRDWERGVATSQDGVPLYSVHFKPADLNEQLTPPPAFSAQFPPGTAAQEAASLRWLSGRIGAAPTQPVPKQTVWEEAHSKFPGLARKAFDRAWTKAVEQAGALDWKRPGPRQRK